MVRGSGFNPIFFVMARKKSSFKGLAILAGAIFAGAYFHEKLEPVIDKAKEALGQK